MSPISVWAKVEEGGTGDVSPHPGRVKAMWCSPFSFTMGKLYLMDPMEKIPAKKRRTELL